MRIFSGIQINRKNIIEEELMNNYHLENDLSKIPDNKPLPPVQNPYENMMMHEFRNNMSITRNGQKISNSDYYGDFKSNITHGVNQKEYIPPCTEYVEQVDPSSFFGNSLDGVVNQLKKQI